MIKVLYVVIAMLLMAIGAIIPFGEAQQSLSQMIIRDGTGDSTQANVSSGRLNVDGSGVTQPVSGTVTVTDGAGALNVIVDSSALPSGAATAANQDGIIKDGSGDTTQANVSGGRLQVENYNANLAADNSVNSTSKSPVMPCTANAAAPLWTEGRQVPCSVDLSGNGRVDIAEINGVTPLMGNGASGTGAQRVTLASDSTGNIATIGTSVTPGTSAAHLGKAEDAAHTTGDTGVAALTKRTDTAASSAGTDGDYATLNTDNLGRVWVRNGGPCQDHARITSAVIDESTAATNQIVALNGSDLIYVCGYKVVTTAASSLRWQHGTGIDCATGLTALEGPQPYVAGGGVAENGGGYPIFIVPAGNALCLTSSVATAHGGRVTYVRTAAP